MSLTKKIAIDEITVTENGIILYREATIIEENGEEISKKYSRTSLTPGQNLTSHPEKVVAICNTVWTPEVIATFQSQFDNKGI
jgi:hypothetical protein